MLEDHGYATIIDAGEQGTLVTLSLEQAVSDRYIFARFKTSEALEVDSAIEFTNVIEGKTSITPVTVSVGDDHVVRIRPLPDQAVFDALELSRPRPASAEIRRLIDSSG